MVLDITNWTALVVALTLFIPAVISLLTFFGVRQVHKIVNSQREAMMSEITALKNDIVFLRERLVTRGGSPT